MGARTIVHRDTSHRPSGRAITRRSAIIPDVSKTPSSVHHAHRVINNLSKQSLSGSAAFTSTIFFNFILSLPPPKLFLQSWSLQSRHASIGKLVIRVIQSCRLRVSRVTRNTPSPSAPPREARETGHQTRESLTLTYFKVFWISAWIDYYNACTCGTCARACVNGGCAGPRIRAVQR